MITYLSIYFQDFMKNVNYSLHPQSIMEQKDQHYYILNYYDDAVNTNLIREIN